MHSESIIIEWKKYSLIISDKFDKSDTIIFIHWKTQTIYSFLNLYESLENQWKSFIWIDMKEIITNCELEINKVCSNYASLISKIIDYFNIEKYKIISQWAWSTITIQWIYDSLLKPEKIVLISPSWIFQNKFNFNNWLNILKEIINRLKNKKQIIKEHTERWKINKIFENIENTNLYKMLKAIKIQCLLISNKNQKYFNIIKICKCKNIEIKSDKDNLLISDTNEISNHIKKFIK